MKLRINHTTLLIFAFTLLEVLFITVLRGVFGYYLSPILLFLCSLIIGIAPLYYMKNKPDLYSFNLKIKPYILIILLAALSVSVFIGIQNTIFNYPVNPLYSDVIPTTQGMVKNFLSGEYAYNSVPFQGYKVHPSYLPMQWLPFIIAEILSFDYRWIGIIVMLTGVGFLLKISKPLSYLITTLFLAAIFFTNGNSNLFKFTVEALIIGYYLFLGYSLNKKRLNWILIGLALSLILLSRFSAVIWLPIYAVVMYRENRPVLFKSLLFLLLAILVIYVIPFLSQDPQSITNHFGKAMSEWEIKDWSKDNKPTALFNGVGFACYFYSFLPFELMLKAKITQIIHMAISFISTLFLMVYYLRSKMDSLQSRLFLVVSLKICLTIFYTFIHVPYPYLYMVNVFFSFAVIIATHKYYVVNSNNTATMQ